VNRREFVTSLLVVGAVGPPRPSPRAEEEPARRRPQGEGGADADYVVVGSGAGGGTVAARLAEKGHSVVVLEAGGDPSLPDPTDYEVPAFHPFATENPAMRWDFFVRHFTNTDQQKRDPKFVPERDGVWYPRAGTLGGCTAHNAMILIAPTNQDWDQIADLTGDPSWRGEKMWSYFQRLEDCRHRPTERFWHHLGINPSRHGYGGWLPTEKAAPREAIADDQVRQVIARSVGNVLKEFGAPSLTRLESLADPNDWRAVDADEVGARYTPLTTDNHQRTGTRERLLSVANDRRYRLRVELNALATRIMLDEQHRAVGVEYEKGERLYSADPQKGSASGERRVIRARREVILAGGTFNTPQLLMLSGIGDPAVLSKCDVPVKVPLPGVGQNLQDRYEVPVVNRMVKPWDMLDGATFTTKDRQYREWADHRRGVYTTNGALLSVVQRSSPGKPAPDLFCYAVLADFRGYQPGYSERIRKRHDCLTWIVLKGHTNNRGGRVTINSPDPHATPTIEFHYFEEGTDASGEDLQAVVDGIKLARRMTLGMRPELIAEEECPGPHVTGDDDLKAFVRDHAWGHHASGTCQIGPQAAGGVLTSDFNVHGTERLRVVDASIFPRIPGLFIVSAIYMAAEKAADVILDSAGRTA
jgi:choline dehydrogenase-like flavoprotein